MCDPGEVSGRVFTMETGDMCPMYKVYEGVHQGNCGHVTPGKGYEVECQRGNYGHVTSGTGGKEVTLETQDV